MFCKPVGGPTCSRPRPRRRGSCRMARRCALQHVTLSFSAWAVAAACKSMCLLRRQPALSLSMPALPAFPALPPPAAEPAGWHQPLPEGVCPVAGTCVPPGSACCVCHLALPALHIPARAAGLPCPNLLQAQAEGLKKLEAGQQVCTHACTLHYSAWSVAAAGLHA